MPPRRIFDNHLFGEHRTVTLNPAPPLPYTTNTAYFRLKTRMDECSSTTSVPTQPHDHFRPQNRMDKCFPTPAPISIAALSIATPHQIRRMPEVAYVEKDQIVRTLDTQRAAPWVSRSLISHIITYLI